jgi:hypothetical protein
MGLSYDAQRNEFCAYVLHETETPYGLLLGNFKTYAQSTAKGGVRGLWDADTDQIIFGTHHISYRLAERTFFPHQIERDLTFLPYAQISEFTLEHRVHVTEAFFVPFGSEFDRAVAFVVDVTLYNPGAAEVEVAIFPWAMLVGQRFYGEPEHEVRAWNDGRFICSKNLETGGERWWGGSRSPIAVQLSLREQVLLQSMRRGTLAKEESTQTLGDVTPQQAELVSRRIFGAFEYRVVVAAGSRESLRLGVVYHKDGTERSRPVLEALLRDQRALHHTQGYFTERLADARFLMPSPEISRGVAWAKANMLRIVKEYPHGWGATNSPPSDILVSRDTSWLVHGFDYFWPEFSRNALEVFNRAVEESGLMIEYVRGVSGYKTDYDLNINDDTPLHVIAMLHHYNATLDDGWVRERIGLVIKLTDYMLTQRDDHGLVNCRAKGVDMYGISSWRNIIPYYTLDGAVTEINAEAVYALEAAAMLCAVVGDNEHWERYGAEAQRMREAIMDYLYNDDTGAFVLNYDQDGNYQDNFTADEVFPVLFGLADRDQRRAILARLQEADFMTPVGLRTISTADARRHLAGSHHLVRRRPCAQRDDRRSRAAAHRLLRGDGGRQPAQHRTRRVRRMVRRRLVEQSWNVSLAVDRREISVGCCGNRRWFGRVSHQRQAAFGAAASEGMAVDCGGSRPLGRAPVYVRRRFAQRHDLRRHGRAIGGRAVYVHSRRARRERRGRDFARRSWRDRVRR